MSLQFRNGVFVITEETSCPLYNIKDEFEIRDNVLSLPVGKQTCMILAQDFVKIALADSSYERFSATAKEKAKFECGGCVGMIRFEYKKDQGFSTLQMQLLDVAERREKVQKVNRFAGLLRSVKMFVALKDEELIDLSTLLELREFPWQFPVAQKGDPGDRLFIVLSGRAEVIDEKGVVLAELPPGEVFGEMSLLSGERVTATIMAATPCQIAIMSQKNFRHILNRFPTLQVAFYKLLVGRITRMNEQRAEELASGMVGQLSDISPVELCQMINSNQKTGKLTLDLGEKTGVVMFKEGEVVQAELDGRDGVEAFYQLMAVADGRFQFSQGLSYRERKYTILGGFMALIMEGMKRIDDERP